MTPSALYGLLSCALLAGAAARFLPFRRPREAGFVLASLALLSIAPLLHGFFVPSFSLTQLALLRLLAPEHVRFPRSGALALLVFAAVFYPLALGLGPFDPYSLGYQPRNLLALFLPLGLWLAWRRQNALLILLAGDLIAYALGIFGNLWDALLDPLLVLAGIRSAIGQGSPKRVA